MSIPVKCLDGIQEGMLLRPETLSSFPSRGKKKLYFNCIMYTYYYLH